MEFLANHPGCGPFSARKLFNKANGSNIAISTVQRWTRNPAAREMKKKRRAEFIELWQADSGKRSLRTLVKLFNQEKNTMLNENTAYSWVRSQRTKEERQHPLPNRETASSREESHSQETPEMRR